MSQDTLAQARAMLEELVEAARTGAIIPIRLTGQLEAVLNTLNQADGSDGASADPTPSGDMEVFKTELAGLLSHGFHDLRLPLTSIRGYSDMLGTPSMGELNAMQQQFLDTIRINSRRMESLLMDVSDLSKLQLGTLKITAKMDMFKNIAMMVEKASNPLADELGRTLIFDIPQGLPILNIDAEMLAKALNKLVENSLRYMDAEGGTVMVRGAADGNLLHIVIEDSGIGMTDEELAKLGTPYFRGDNEIVLNFKGSGLGIPIAYGILQQLGGTVDVTSQPEQGSTFTVTLPGMA